MPTGVYERKPIEDRFWEKVNVGGPDDCWEWTAWKNNKGYGQISYQGKLQLAHRFSWKLANEDPPGEMCVLHRCDNPLCVNPNHLFLGTQKDNMQDKKRKRRTASQKGTENGKAKLTEENVLRIRELYSTGNYYQRELAVKYKVSRSQIKEIVNRKQWRHI